MFEKFRARSQKTREVRANARLSRSELEAAKITRFREFAKLVSLTSPYYARVIAERNINVDTCYPADFPVLTKSLLMTHFDDIVTDRRLTKAGIADFLTRSRDPAELYLNRYTVIHTSGSSGEVGYFVYSPADMGRATPMRRQQRGPSKPRARGGRFRLAFYGATDGHYAGVTMVSQVGSGLFRLFVQTRALEVNSPLPRILTELNAYQPDFLAGYTTALKILAEQQLSGRLKISPRAIACSGEATTPADRELLKKAFGSVVYNGYACSEHLSMGSTEPDGDEIILHDDDLMFEFQPDHCLITNLFNQTLPLIRYRMSDTLLPIESDRHAPYQAIRSLVGRNEIQPVFRNHSGAADFISPHTINEIFVRGITRFQFHWLSESSFEFLVCMENALTAEEKEQCRGKVIERWQEILARKELGNLQFAVRVVDDIPLNPRTRKFQLIVDRRKGSTSSSPDQGGR